MIFKRRAFFKKSISSAVLSFSLGFILCFVFTFFTGFHGIYGYNLLGFDSVAFDGGSSDSGSSDSGSFDSCAVMGSLSIVETDKNSENQNTSSTGGDSTHAGGETGLSHLTHTQEEILLIPCGVAVGVRIDTDGILVLGTGYVNGSEGEAKSPSEGIIKAGDLILSINGSIVNSKEELSDFIKESDSTVNIKLKRDEDIVDVFVEPVNSLEDGKKKIGLWVRDSTQGIGTITYINPNNGKYGALGHGIMDVDTKQLMDIKGGVINYADVHSIKKGKKGSPGELIGDIMGGEDIGNVKINNPYGIYGELTEGLSDSKRDSVAIAYKSEITEGEAIVLSNIGGDGVKEYSAQIESVNRITSDDTKGLIIRITDDALLDKTNGIVQGMSGSPIIQNGKLVGAITHVFVQDPTKGYGIFIENMIKQENCF